MDTSIHIPDLIQRLDSEDDSVRKMAVFKLQSAIGDPSFADVFIQEGGLSRLRHCALDASGNTLAYTLATCSRLLELDMGWEVVSDEVIDRVVDLVVSHPLVNILRGAMSILVAIVSHPSNRASGAPGAVFGYKRLKASVSKHAQFLEMLVSRLSSADHALCANALQLINSLMRDSITNEPDSEWPKFIKKLQDLGVIKAVYGLMQSTALQDLAHPLLEFQSLTKTLLRKWKDVKIDLEKSDHRRAMKGLHLASLPENQRPSATDKDRGSRKHNPEKWRRLGFETESPAWEFDDTGFLGMMDITDFVRKSEDGFQKLLLEQSAMPAEQRCPVARASLAVTAILYEHFEVDKAEIDENSRYVMLESRSNFDRAFKPLLLQWSRLHTSGLHAFLRLWKATGAEMPDDFEKVVELVRILVEQVVGQAERTKDIQEVEDELSDFDLSSLRKLQMELLELTYEDAWGHHLRQVRDTLDHEALQFVKEQRIRCLLSGAWFPHSITYPPSTPGGPITQKSLSRTVPQSWRYVKLSHNRRYLHYSDFETKQDTDPDLGELEEKIDLSIVSSVVSNVSASPPSTSSSTATVKETNGEDSKAASTSTRITIHGYANPSSQKHARNPSARTNGTNHSHKRSKDTTSPQNAQGSEKEIVLLTLHPQSHTLASEWLDGLLMLLNQQPITNDTNKLVNLIGGYGLKIRLLNVRFEDLELGDEVGMKMPTREGLDEDYFYDIGGMEGS